MIRFAFSAIAAVFMMGQVALASAQDDAAYIATQQLPQDVLAALRDASAQRFVKRAKAPLAAIGARISDPDRFAAMLPQSVTDGSVLYATESFTSLALELFTPQELSEIATFLRTDASQKLLAAQQGQSPAVGDKDINLTLPDLLPDMQRDLPEPLTTQEIAISRAFLQTAGGRVLGEKMQDTRFFLALLSSLTRSDRVELRLDAAYMIQIIEADGIVIFPNRILRRDAIKKLRNVGP